MFTLKMLFCCFWPLPIGLLASGLFDARSKSSERVEGFGTIHIRENARSNTKMFKMLCSNTSICKAIDWASTAVGMPISQFTTMSAHSLMSCRHYMSSQTILFTFSPNNAKNCLFCVLVICLFILK